MSQQGTAQQFRMDGQGAQSGDKGQGRGFQAGGPTGPHPAGEVGGSQQGHPSAAGSQLNRVLCLQLTS